MAAGSLTAQVAGFVVGAGWADVPEETRWSAKQSLLDSLGLSVAGTRSAVYQIARRHVEGQLGAGGADAGLASLPPRFGALLTGIAIHADDYDDTQLAVGHDRVYGLLTHPSAPVLGAVLPLAATLGSSGEDALMAYLVGVEVACKVAEAIDPRHYRDGFHSTGTVGAIGAAAAGARLLDLDEQRTRYALGLGAAQAGGLRENFGTMGKPFHAGRAAESGVVAADMAARGMVASDTILEAPRGFFQAAGGGYDAAAIDGLLGAPWAFTSPGVSIKPHPSGSLTHPGMTAMRELVIEHDVRPEDVTRIEVRTNSQMPNALIHHKPTDELQAKFSMPFCMAILVLEREAGLGHFTDEVVLRPDVQALVDKVSFEGATDLDDAGHNLMLTRIAVELSDGTRLERESAHGKGHPENPMSYEELGAKFLQCVRWGGGDETAGKDVMDVVKRIEEEPGVGPLLELLDRE